ncbi:MAG: methyl-accepting chemotaxis protein [Candidatus Sericytochromatia bacterium]
MKSKIAYKLILSAILSFLPSIFLLYTLIIEMSHSTNFTNKEIDGLKYIKTVKLLLQNLPEHKLNTQKYLLGNVSVKNKILEDQKNIDEAFKEFLLVDEKNKLDPILSDKIDSIKKDWDLIKKESLSISSEKSDIKHTNLLNNLKKIIIYIGDSSNLIRDPEMTSFYLIDSTIVKLTSKINISDSVIEISDKILSEQDLSNEQKKDADDLKDLLGETKKNTKTSIDLDDKATITMLLGLLNSISSELREGYSKSFINNQDIKKEFEEILNREAKTTDIFIKNLNNNILKNLGQTNTNTLEKLGKDVLKTNFELWDKTVSNIEILLNERVNSFNTRKYLISTLSLILLLISSFIGLYIVKNIVKSINILKETAGKVADGELNIKVDIISDDEIGDLGKSFNYMINNIKSANQKLKDGSVSIDLLQEKIDSLNVITKELEKAKSESERNSLNLESLIKETSASIYEIKQTSDLVADNARIVSEAAELSVHISTDGSKAVKDSIKSVDKIKSQIEAIAEKILELSKQTQAIGDIISTVDDISKQSRLLAFNASIEATKANEYGKGFSVVASEIRAMAEESREATKRISNILRQIQHFTNNIVMLTEDGMKLADIGVDLSKVAGDSIDKLIDSINNSSEVAAQISVSSLEQKTGMEQLEESMKKIAFRSL